MTAKTILAYYRASLADGERMDIRAKTVVMQGAAFPAGAEDWEDCSAKLFKGLDDKIKRT